MENNNELFNKFEEKLETSLIEIATAKGMLDGKLYIVDELVEKWDEIAPEYLADAIKEIKDYPTVAIAWSGYIGMGIASLWDTVWEDYSKRSNIYAEFSAPRGFDCMDEYVLEEMLNLQLESQEAVELENLMRSLSNTALTLIRKENIEPMSSDAFYIYARTIKIMFKIGVSVILKKLGYKYEKVTVCS